MVVVVAVPAVLLGGPRFGFFVEVMGFALGVAGDDATVGTDATAEIVGSTGVGAGGRMTGVTTADGMGGVSEGGRSTAGARAAPT